MASQGPKLSKTVVVRISARDYERMLRAARVSAKRSRRRVTLSDVMRLAVRRYLKQLEDALRAG